MTDARVLGVDAFSQGWVGVAVAGGYDGAYVAARIDELVAVAEADGPLAVVAVDMPVGLPDAGPRQADVLAKRWVGPRHSSVFMTPVRAAMVADDFRQACEIARCQAGGGISRQAYALRAKLLEVDGWVRGNSHRVVEVHPEVSFAALAGHPLAVGKKTWGGMALRRRLLAGAGIVLPDALGAADVVGVDDVLDAAAAAWSAWRVLRGEASSLPAQPEIFTDGLPAAIWY
jgi:predicted RNase H-like nuclease